MFVCVSILQRAHKKAKNEREVCLGRMDSARLEGSMVELHSLKDDVEMNARVGVCKWFNQQTRYFSVKLFAVGKSRYESTLLVHFFGPD